MQAVRARWRIAETYSMSKVRRLIFHNNIRASADALLAYVRQLQYVSMVEDENTMRHDNNVIKLYIGLHLICIFHFP